MTVLNTASSITYAGTGGVSAFPFPYKFFEDSDIKVYEIIGNVSTLLTSGYALSYSDPSAGCSVITNYFPAAGTQLYIERELAEEQTTDIPTGGAFLESTAEGCWDRAVMLIQQLSRRVARSPLMTIASGLGNILFPSPSANQLIGWNSLASGLENKIPSTVTIGEIAVIGDYGDSIEDAVTTIGATEKTVIINKLVTLAVGVTVPDNINFAVIQGGMIDTAIYDIFIPKVEAGRYQIFAGSGTVSGLKESRPEWFGINGSTDQTAIQKAFDSVYSTSFQPHGSYYEGINGKIIFSPTRYKVSDTVISANQYVQIVSEGATIEQSVAGKDILDFTDVYKLKVEGSLVLIGGKKQLRVGNANRDYSEVDLTGVRFTYNNSAVAFETYAVAPATTLSMTVNTTGCSFIDVYQVMNIAKGTSVKQNGGWVHLGAIDLTRAAYINYGELFFDGVYGVPNGTATPVGARWIDNYGDFHATKTRFGGEGGGMPIVNQHNITRANNVGGGVVDIKNSQLNVGATAVRNTVIHLMTGIPGRINISDNDWGNITTSIISIEGGFNVATYIGSLAANDKIFINIGNNSSFLPLERLGLPSALINTDKSKVIISEPYKPFANVVNKSLLHFDGANAGTTIIDEFMKTWTVDGNAALSTTLKRFGVSSLAIPDAASWITTTDYTSLGSAFTIEFWFSLTNVNTNDQTIFTAVDAATGYGLILYYNQTAANDKKLRLKISSDNSTWDVGNDVAGTKTDWVNGTWYKLTLEFTGTRYSLYVNSIGTIATEDKGIASTSLVNAITQIWLGAGAVSMTGYIDEFRMLLNDYRYGGLFMPESQKFNID